MCTVTGPPGDRALDAARRRPKRTSMPAPAQDVGDSSPANGSVRASSAVSAHEQVVSWAPRACSAWDISQADAPAAEQTSRSGTCWTTVASRLVHGRASAQPGTSGIEGSLPVATTTACRAAAPCAAVRRRHLGPQRPGQASPAPDERRRDSSIQLTWPPSSRWDTASSRRASTAAASIGPRSSRPGTRLTSAASPTGRSSALLGTHA